MLFHLSARGMNVGQRRATEFELGARLERNRGQPALERNRRATGTLRFGSPTETTGKFGHHGQNTHRARVGNRFGRQPYDSKLFRFGADSPIRAWLFGLLEDADQVGRIVN